MKKWPLIENLALAAGHERDAVRKWRERGRVPFRHRFPLIKLAAAKGETLENCDFDMPRRKHAA